MTTKEFFTIIANSYYNEKEETLNIVERAFGIVEFAKIQLAKLARESEKRKNTLTKTQRENNVIKAEILNALKERASAATLAEIREQFPAFSVQKLSALLSQLATDNKVTKSVNKDKKTTYTAI